MEPFVPRILLVADTKSEPDRFSRLKAELSAAGLPLQHCGSVGEAGELCASLHFDCAVVDAHCNGPLGPPPGGPFDQLPRIVLTTPGSGRRASARGRKVLPWREANVDRLVSEVRKLIEERGQDAALGSSAPGRPASAPGLSESDAAAPAELRAALDQLRNRFAQVESVFDSLRSLSESEQGEALVEIALFAQRHEEVIGGVWASVRACERALGRMDLATETAADEEPTTWVGPSDGGLSLQPENVSEPAAAPRRRVLVVDDDPTALRAFRRVLQPNCEVLTARDGGEALGLVMEHAIDVVACDLSMPKVDGRTFFHELSELKPELMSRVIFCTGGAPSDATHGFLNHLTNTVLSKPVDVRDLLLAIERVCTAKPSSVPFRS